MKTCLSLVGLILVLCSCQTGHYPVIKHNFITHFEDYRNYRLCSPITASKDTAKLYETINKEIEYQMTLRGYEYDSLCPQLSIEYMICKEKVSIANSNTETDEIYFVGNESDSESKNGTFLIQMIDNQTNKVVWLSYFSRLNFLNHELSATYLKLKTKDILKNYRYFVEKKPTEMKKQETPIISAIF